MKRRNPRILLLLGILCSVLVLSASCNRNSNGNASKPSEPSAPAVKSVTVSNDENAKKSGNDEIFAPSPVVKTDVEEESAALERIADANDEMKTEIASDEEEKAVSTSVYEGVYSYGGYTSYIVVDHTAASLTIPEEVSYEDVVSVASMIASSYPSETSQIIYDIKDNTVILTYPEQSDEYLLSVLGALETEAETILDQYPLKAEVVEVVELEENSVSSPLLEVDFSYKGYSADIAVYSTYATVMVPDSFNREHLEELAVLLASVYPAEVSLVTYTLSEKTLTLYYPEQKAQYLTNVVNMLSVKAMKLIDSVTKVEESDVIEEDSSVSTETETPESVAEEPTTQTSLNESAGKTKRFSLSVVGEGVYTFDNEKFNFAFGLRGGVNLGCGFSLGFDASYSMASYIEAGAFVRYAFASLSSLDFYALAGGGGVFGIADNSGKNGGKAFGALGMDYAFSDAFSLFVEGRCGWSAVSGFNAGGSLGASFSF